MSEIEYQQLIFGSIFLLSNKFSLLGDRVTKDITLKQWLLLNMILNMQDKKPNYVELAAAIGTTRQNISKMLSLLEKKGMVSLETSNDDQRAIIVKLTKKSFEYFAIREHEGNKLLEKLFCGLSSVETKLLSELIMKVVRSTEIALMEVK